MNDSSRCSGCGAPSPIATNKCRYCGLTIGAAPPPPAAAQPRFDAPPPPREGPMTQEEQERAFQQLANQQKQLLKSARPACLGAGLFGCVFIMIFFGVIATAITIFFTSFRSQIVK